MTTTAKILLIALALGTSLGRADENRPNVLFLFSDQHNADVLGCADHPLVKTPNLDALADQGVRFTRAYCQAGICIPSRTSMLTGLYPRTTGCIDNPNQPLHAERYVMLQQAFQQNGYRTGCFGKRHLHEGISDDASVDMSAGWDHSATTINPKGDPSDESYYDWLEARGLWETYEAVSNQKLLESDLFCRISGLKPDERDAAYTAAKSVQFVTESQSQGKPFFCWATFHGPHQPYTPPQKWADMYPIDEMPLPASIDQPIEQLPPELQGWRRNERQPWNLAVAARNPDMYRRYIAYYLAQVTEIDHYIGQIMKALNELGLAESTIVIYASDHGDFVAGHGMVEKCALGHNVYEETLRIPLIFAWPGRFQQGVERDDLVELVDLYPTLVDLVELDRPKNGQQLAGRSLEPTLIEGTPVGRSYAVSENWSQVTVITDRYKLGQWVDPGPLPRYATRDIRGKFPDMLFDRQTDPGEVDNLIGQPATAEIERELRAHLSEWLETTSDRGRREIIEAGM